MRIDSWLQLQVQPLAQLAPTPAMDLGAYSGLGPGLLEAREVQPG